MNAVVKLTDISKEFPSGDSVIEVLHNISLEIYSGEITMIVGPSGCGKTTLISIMSGILHPTKGQVELFGQNLNEMKDSEKALLRRDNIGFIFQQFNLLPALTSVENASMPLLAADVEYTKAESSAANILGKIGMKDHLDKLPNQLSGGQQQRVSIARALVHNPKLIVCDEPTSSLDANTGHTVMEILRDTATDSNRAVIVVTHDNRIYEFADRIIYMTDGRIEREERPKKNHETQQKKAAIW